MSILRKIVLVFLAGLLPLFLFLLAIDLSINRTLGSSQSIKKILNNSGIYESLIPNLIEQTKASSEGGEGINLNDPAVKQIAEQAIPPQFLRENTEKFLDSVFLWLEGKSETPDFKLDLSTLQASFNEVAAKIAADPAAALPACPAGLSGRADSFDPFSATCLPKGVSAAAIGAQIKSSLDSGEGLLKDPVISADSIKLEGSNQSVFADQLKDVPSYYQQAKNTPLYLAILGLLIALGIIFLSTDRAHGLRRVGIILLVVGVLLLASAWALNWGVNQKALPSLKLNNQVLQDNLKALAKDITDSLGKTYYIIGGVYAGLGALAIAVPMFIHRRNGHPVHEPVAAEHMPTEGQKTEEPEPKPRPLKKPPTKIQ